MKIPLATDNMLAEVDGSIGWMTFNKPARRNAVSLDMWEAMPVILDRFEQDPAVRVIVLKGAGDQAFVSGADISQFEQARASPDSNAHYEAVSGAAGRRLTGCSKPTIAMIRGFCIGGGLAIAIGCDIRIAGEGARFGIPAARLGLGYGTSGVKQLMQLVGPSFTKEIFFTARHFSSTEAREMGLVNRVVADDIAGGLHKTLLLHHRRQCAHDNACTETLGGRTRARRKGRPRGVRRFGESLFR